MSLTLCSNILQKEAIAFVNSWINASLANFFFTGRIFNGTFLKFTFEHTGFRLATNVANLFSTNICSVKPVEGKYIKPVTGFLAGAFSEAISIAYFSPCLTFSNAARKVLFNAVFYMVSYCLIGAALKQVHNITPYQNCRNKIAEFCNNGFARVLNYSIDQSIKGILEEHTLSDDEKKIFQEIRTLYLARGFAIQAKLRLPEDMKEVLRGSVIPKNIREIVANSTLGHDAKKELEDAILAYYIKNFYAYSFIKCFDFVVYIAVYVPVYQICIKVKDRIFKELFNQECSVETAL